MNGVFREKPELDILIDDCVENVAPMLRENQTPDNNEGEILEVLLG